MGPRPVSNLLRVLAGSSGPHLSRARSPLNREPRWGALPLSRPGPVSQTQVDSRQCRVWEGAQKKYPTWLGEVRKALWGALTSVTASQDIRPSPAALSSQAFFLHSWPLFILPCKEFWKATYLGKEQLCGSGCGCATLQGCEVPERSGIWGSPSLATFLASLNHCPSGCREGCHCPSRCHVCRCYGLVRAPLTTLRSSWTLRPGYIREALCAVPDPEEAPHLAILDNSVCPLVQLLLRTLPLGG